MNLQEITAAEARALVVKAKTPIQKEILDQLGAFSEWKIRKMPGGELQGDLEVGPDVLLVEGSLRVGGRVQDGNKADQTLLIVLGDLRARDLVALSSIQVGGSLQISNAIYGNSMGDDTLLVGGETRARGVIGDGHWFKFHGGLKAEVRISADTTDTLKDPDFDGEELKRALIPEVLSGGRISLKKMIAALSAGKDVLKKDRVRAVDEAMAALLKRPAADVVRINDKRLKVFPKELVRFKALKKLSLDSDEIRELPPEVGALRELRELRLGGNQLTELQKEIGRLSKLEVLDLHFNQLKSLPPEIGELRALRHADLHHNKLCKLPAQIGRLDHLKVLDVGDNELRDLPKLPLLEELHLSSNPWPAFPKAVANCSSLKKLYLDRGDGDKPMSASVLAGVATRTDLLHLDLSRWNFSKVPQWLKSFTRLEGLDLGFGKLTALPSWFGNLSALNTLMLNNNKFGDSNVDSLAASLKELPALKVVDINSYDFSVAGFKRLQKALPRVKLVIDSNLLSS